MQKADIKPGREYAVREPVATGVEFQRVKVLEHIRRGNWRVEWIDPNPGLVDYLKSKNIIVPWGERRAFLRDEERAEAVVRANEATFPGDGHPITDAIDVVFECTGEQGFFLVKGILYHEHEALERLAARAGVEVPSHPAGYRDRHGRSYLPFSCALELAHAFAAAEPQTVLDAIDAEERELAAQVREPGYTHLSSLLTDYRARWAIVRQWAGHDAAVAAREGRITELEQLLNQVMWELRRDGVDPERVANRIGRALRSG